METRELIQFLQKIVDRDYPEMCCQYEQGLESGQKELAYDLIKILSKPPRLYQD